MTEWLLVDDSHEESQSFAIELSRDGVLTVTPLSAQDAEELLKKNSLEADGILMDVDLSSETGMRTTGPGFAQNIRVAQKRKLLPSFAIVRFSFREKIRENIGSDSSSDDVFDLKIEKDDLSDSSKCDAVRIQLQGVSEVYRSTVGTFAFPNIVGLNEEGWKVWGHQAFEQEMAIADLPYLKAGRLIRFLVHPGILIAEELLAIRLGIDREQSNDWQQLMDKFDKFKYKGVAHEFFPRWWARGLEDWWLSLGAAQPLAGSSIDERHSLLTEQICPNLIRLEMPNISPGNRPWRTCLLSLEEHQDVIPVDPTRAVRVIPREPLPLWMDPFVTALGLARRHRKDPRLDKSDLDRLSHIVK